MPARARDNYHCDDDEDDDRNVARQAMHVIPLLLAARKPGQPILAGPLKLGKLGRRRLRKCQASGAGRPLSLSLSAAAHLPRSLQRELAGPQSGPSASKVHYRRPPFGERVRNDCRPAGRPRAQRPSNLAAAAAASALIETLADRASGS